MSDDNVPVDSGISDALPPSVELEIIHDTFGDDDVVIVEERGPWFHPDYKRSVQQQTAAAGSTVADPSPPGTQFVNNEGQTEDRPQPSSSGRVVALPANNRQSSGTMSPKVNVAVRNAVPDDGMSIFVNIHSDSSAKHATGVNHATDGDMIVDVVMQSSGINAPEPSEDPIIVEVNGHTAYRGPPSNSRRSIIIPARSGRAMSRDIPEPRDRMIRMLPSTRSRPVSNPEMGRHEEPEASVPESVDDPESRMEESDASDVIPGPVAPGAYEGNSVPAQRPLAQARPSREVNPPRTSNGQVENVRDLEAPPRPRKSKKSKKSFCPICRMLVTSKRLAQHNRTFHETTPPETRTCRVCGILLQDKFGLWEHEQGHRVQAPKGIQCPHCDKVLSSMASTRKHIASFHTPGNFPCRGCDAVLPSRHEYEEHARNCYLL